MKSLKLTAFSLVCARCKQKIDDLIFQHARLNLRHHATIAPVELRGLVRFLVRRRQLLDPLFDPALVEFDLMLLEQFLDQQADRDPPLGERDEALARRRLLRIGDAHLP